MKYNLIIILFFAFILVSCGTNPKPNQSEKATTKEHNCAEEGHDHSADTHNHATEHEHSSDCKGDHKHAEHSGHSHEAPEVDAHAGHDHGTEAVEDEHAGHDHGAAKIQYTAYSNDFELFAEADAFVAGDNSTVLSHFSVLPNFKALDQGSITVSLIVGGHKTSQRLSSPTRKGIYSFDVKAEKAGTGQLVFDLVIAEKAYQIVIQDVIVYSDDATAAHAADDAASSETNATVFTKEQSWKIDFATVQPTVEPFGQAIKTTAMVQPVQSNEVMLTAKSNGIVSIVSEAILEGVDVRKGDPLFQISGKGLAENNSAVRFSEAKNNFEMAKSEYERAQALSKERIVSEKALLEAKTKYENAKVVFENLEGNFTLAGQVVVSPISGFIKHLHVQNGQYVEAGAPLAMVSNDQTVILKAEVQQKYASLLDAVSSANIRATNSNTLFTLKELNGKVLSYGRAANSDNYLIPIYLQVENRGDFMVGGFADIYLETTSNQKAVTVPNTAILEEMGAFFVFVQITPELFEKREVKSLSTNGLRTEISGINPSERVVSKGAIMVKLSKDSGALDAHSGHVH